MPSVEPTSVLVSPTKLTQAADDIFLDCIFPILETEDFEAFSRTCVSSDSQILGLVLSAAVKTIWLS